MKILLALLLLLFVATNNTGFAQEWRDTLNRARELYKSGNYKEALKYYKSAERIAPKDVDLSEEKGQSAYRAGKYKEAEEAFQSAAGRLSDKKRKSSAYNNIGNSRMKQRDYAGAEEAFKESLRLNPENEKARQGLAEAKRMKKKQEEEQQKKQNNNSDSNENDGDGGSNSDPSKGDKQQSSGSKSQNSNSKPDSQQGNSKQQSSSSSSQAEKKQPSQQANSGQKLSDKQTERKLDELMRQEMDAKKRLDGAKGKTNGSKAKKDW